MSCPRNGRCTSILILRSNRQRKNSNHVMVDQWETELSMGDEPICIAQQVPKLRIMQTSLQSNIIAMDDSFGITVLTVQWTARPCDSEELLDLCPSSVTNLACHRMSRTSLACWAEARLKIARMTLTIKLDGNWRSFQLANSALSVTDIALLPLPQGLWHA